MLTVISAVSPGGCGRISCSRAEDLRDEGDSPAEAFLRNSAIADLLNGDQSLPKIGQRSSQPVRLLREPVDTATNPLLEESRSNGFEATYTAGL
jgi:hypothetical protein